MKNHYIFGKALFLCLSIGAFYQVESQVKKQIVPPGSTKWLGANPFESNFFIKNMGQFDGATNLTSDKVLYGIRNEGMEMYFTANGLTYKHDDVPTITEKEKDLLEEKKISIQDLPQTKSYFVNEEWIDANPNATIIAEDQANNYYTYANLKDIHGTSIKASAYKKIIYKNLYPNIDVEYTFPNNKKGIKYAIILHPGADASLIKMRYSNMKKSKEIGGNIQIISDFGIITDHQPTTSYQNGAEISSKFELSANVVSFHLGSYDVTKTVVIDPWTTVPTFTGTNDAYDIDCDKYGNVYIYGGTYPFQEIGLSPAGTILWTFTGFSGSANAYGDFAVDNKSGTSYLIEGWNSGASGARVLKVNSVGTQTGLFPGNPLMGEMWRIAFNNCTKQGVIAGGNTTTAQNGCMLDTNMVNMPPTDVLASGTNYHDFALLALDNYGSAYMATSTSLQYPTVLNNIITKMPVPALTPFTYQVGDNYKFAEYTSTQTYVVGNPTTGFNGIAISPNFMYTYDGDTLKKWNFNTGAMLAKVQVTPTPYLSGGLQVDNCDNLYVGAGNVFKQYDANLNLISTTPLAGNVCDLKLQGNMIYAAGYAFVQAIQITSTCIASPLNLSIIASDSCSTKGTATVTVTGGIAPFSYVWSTSPVQTTATATNLNPGSTYTVTVRDNACPPDVAIDSIKIPLAGIGAFLPSATVTNVTCFGGNNGAATISNTGGSNPFTYSWLPGGQTTPTITGLTAGTYTVSVEDGAGCVNKLNVVVVQSPQIKNVFSNTIDCSGGNNSTATANPSGGKGAYTYSWNLGSQTTQTITGLGPGNYSLTVTDSSGCSQSFVDTITTSPVVIAFTKTNVTCNGSNNGAVITNVSGGTTPTYTYSWSPGGQTTQNISFLTAGTYTLTVNNGGCSNSASVIISQPAAISSVNTHSNVMCNGGNTGTVTATASGGSGKLNYSWSTAPSQTTATATGLTAGVYTLTITDSLGCSKSFRDTIKQPPLIVATFNRSNVTCFGANDGSLTVNTSGGSGTFTYSWNTTPTKTTPSVTGLPPGTYSVTVTDSLGCIKTFTDTVKSPIQMSVTFTQSNENCYGESIGSATANATGGPTTNYVYSWSSNPVQITQTATALPAGTYTLTVESGSCSTTGVVIISQPAMPHDTLTINVSLCAGDTVTTLHGPNGVSGPFQWFFDTTAVGNPVDSILVLPSNINQYTVQWYLGGCKRKTSLIDVSSPGITIDPKGVANVFTPNGDGKNDVFIPLQGYEPQIEYYISNFNIKIFNRWGEKIFESSNYKAEWNGENSRGDKMPEGVYYWIATYQSRCSNNAPSVSKGFVHLLR
ncbi:MAG: gliding motility-associated C-terminal domain-containing protein [Bacteroidia bacterium]